jgi:hypothetical protein
LEAATKSRLPRDSGLRLQPSQRPKTTPGLFLPGALFMAIGAQLFTAFVFVDLAFAAFL